jgi:predicted N-acyltransferase
MSTELRVLAALGEVARSDWDALLADDATPFERWTWLSALEESGCASAERGWLPQHLTLWRAGRLVAAAPAYLKADSEGDFSRDWGWAEAAARAGIAYYPKLVLTVPFTPVGGHRLHVAAGEDRAAAVQALVGGAIELGRSHRAGAMQVLYPTEPEAVELAALGLLSRLDFQWHWRNRGYHDLTEWLATLGAKRRHQARRERAAPAAQGILIRTVRGDSLAERPEESARAVHAFYRANIDKLMWGRPWLNERFFVRVFREMPEYLEVVEARREGRLVAGAVNVAGAGRLYGRYWGCHEEHPFLHFNVCLYHSIEQCIERGVSVFEGGAGGSHKESRGFELAPTWSAHHFLDHRLQDGISDYLEGERRVRTRMLETWREERAR